METDSVSETLFSGFLEYQMMEKEQKPNNSVIHHHLNPLGSTISTCCPST
jgi:hypothetical protein